MWQVSAPAPPLPPKNEGGRGGAGASKHRMRDGLKRSHEF